MSSSTAPTLPERPKRPIGWVIGAALVVVALVVAGALLTRASQAAPRPRSPRAVPARRLASRPS